MIMLSKQNHKNQGIFFVSSFRKESQSKGACFYIMCNNHNIQTSINQEVETLSDRGKNSKERPWVEKKSKSLELASSYKRIGLDNKYLRVKGCGSHLSFKKNKANGERKLHSMISCQVRLCSLCNWRRSLKIYGQMSKVMDKALEKNDYRFIFLTLTCKNIKGEELSDTIDKLFHAFKKMSERKVFKKAVKGWFRALEITHDVDEFITKDMYYGNKKMHIKSRQKHYDKLGLSVGDRNPNFDFYHPHFHIVLMVNKSYFKTPEIYLSQKDWTSLWKSCLKVDYNPRVDVRTFKTAANGEASKSVAETAKYTVKDNDYLIPENEELTDKTVMILDDAIANRRLIAFGGELRKIHRELNLDDAVDGDLVNTDNEDDEIREDVKYQIEVYDWHVGYKQYVRRKE